MRIQKGVSPIVLVIDIFNVRYKPITIFGVANCQIRIWKQLDYMKGVIKLSSGDKKSGNSK